MIKAVIFDLDGTLANTLEDLTDGVNLALKKYGYPERTVEEICEFVGNGILNLLDRASSHKTDEEGLLKLRDEFYTYYSDHYCYKTYAYEGMAELIDALRVRGLMTAVVTNKDDEVAKTIVKNLLGERFNIVRGKLDGCPAKPDPTSTLAVMKELGVTPDECVFLGDSGVDIMTGANSGATAVGETWGFRDESHLKEHGAKYIIHEPSELLGIIDSLNK